ncbi:uncharacterized protein VTP21DRAFT_2901 [Calcarisporiella thermophila]|uniref:uncharacterized protein n=1 Tax=Calcarisporiella thermophila TaxID=911321 RepID=UPI003742192A
MIKYVVLVVFSLTLLHTAIARKCLCLPSDDCWPNPQDWASFNASVGGQLLIPTPPAQPCHLPHYDEAACHQVMQNWNNSFWRSDQVGAMQNTNWEMDGGQGCPLGTDKNAPCLQGSIPAYAVNVSSISDVQKTIKFATDRKLRLVIKNSGHDHLGRSSAPGSLSLWTHHLKNITFHDNFMAENCDLRGTSPAVTVGAGVHWAELYREVKKRNIIIVGGSSATIGAAGGYVQGGGHSALSPLYGLSADNVLEFKVVTADGELRTANACQNKDLFWALRGGGGGTFGVVISATHRTYKELDGVVATFYSIAANNSDSNRFMVKEFMKIHPSLSDAVFSGYFFLFDKNLTFVYLYPSANETHANITLAPLLTSLQGQKGLTVMGTTRTLPSYMSWHQFIKCSANSLCTDPVGDNAIIGSRLIPRENFETDQGLDQLTDALIQVTKAPLTDQWILGMFVAGGAVARNNGSETSVNPAWRKTLVHMEFTTTWANNATQEEISRRAEAVTRTTQLLKDITPGSGVYINEADPNDPEWQQSYFGANYPRLKAIKRTIDPQGLFRCRKCVGSEDWTEDLNCEKS